MPPAAAALRTRRRPRTASSTNGRSTARREVMLAVLMQFRVVVRSIRRHYRWVERKSGVSGAQLWAMAQVDASPGIRVGELARELAIHQSTASNLLDGLQTIGLIERKRVGEDQRVVRLYLTSKGQQILRRAPRPFRGVLQQGLADLPTTSLNALQRHLAALIRHMKVRDSDAKVILLSDVVGDDK